MSARRFRRRQLKAPAEGLGVVTHNESGVLLHTYSGTLDYGQMIVVRPDNSEGAAAYDVSEGEFPSGTMVLVEDEHGAGSNAIAVTPQGSFVDTDGGSLAELEIDTNDGFALLLVAGGVTVVLASKGASFGD